MKFSYFSHAFSRAGQECTRELYLEVTQSEELLLLATQIAQTLDKDERSKLKQRLPAVTWQAFFPHVRKKDDAQPSGLFMLDIDHVDNPFKLYQDKICGKIQSLGIVYVGKTISTHGVRVVCKCPAMLKTLPDCQLWLAKALGVPFDSVCKDWSRLSFLTPDSYTFYMDADTIWNKEPEAGTVYNIDDEPLLNAEKDGQLSFLSPTCKDEDEETEDSEEEKKNDESNKDEEPQYKGLPYQQIIKEWFDSHGGEPTEGERNSMLYKLALRLRYLCDFNVDRMMRVIPSYGLPKEEVKSLCASACKSTRAQDLPQDIREIVNKLLLETKLGASGEDVEPELITPTDIPPTPPVIRQFVSVAPDDFKMAVALCQLPILGALGSKLRAKYLDGKMHSPSFQVSLEAPQASGKSFLTRLCEYELKDMREHDELEREREREYDNKVKELRLLNVKVTVDNKDEVLGSRPQTLIRYVPATMSVTRLLQRMSSAQGLHLFAFSEEIDTVTKAFKRGFSSYSDLLRVSFDNGLYGQDFASENSFSGNVPIFYNFLTSGTPKAMRRFYPDVEDGLVSRVLFVTLPDQFGKKMPVWREFTEKEKSIVDLHLTRLNEVTLQGNVVQPDHVMKLDWLNAELQKWITHQQAEAIRTNDRTRDVFCRRSAVVGFRAGMLAWFLYGEVSTPTIRKNVIRFSTWVANCMLTQHMLRFDLKTSSNTNPYSELLEKLPVEFTQSEADDLRRMLDVHSPIRNILYKWRLNNLITEVDQGFKTKKNDTRYRKNTGNGNLS